jgi:purine-binding chemotaxis protein CheW
MPTMGGRSSEPTGLRGTISWIAQGSVGRIEKRLSQMNATAQQNKSATVELITFLIGKQEFCVDVMSVREIRVFTPVTPVAHAPSFVRGMINLRGVVLPVIDLAARLGLPPTEASTRHAFLVVEVRAQVVGLLVEGVTEILTVSRELIQSTPDVASRIAKEFVSGIVTTENRMISLLALDAILPAVVEKAAA